MHDLLFRLRTLFRRHAAEGELDDELRFHLERQIAKYLRSGMSKAEAERRVRLEFGGLDQVKDQCREALGISFIETLVQDLLFHSNPAPLTRIHLLRSADSGARYRRQYCDL